MTHRYLDSNVNSFKQKSKLIRLFYKYFWGISVNVWIWSRHRQGGNLGKCFNFPGIRRLKIGMCFPGGSDSKASVYSATRPGFNPWVGKIPWRRKWQSTPVLLPGKSHGQRSPVGYSPWGRKELDTTEQLHFLSFPGGTSSKNSTCQCRRHRRHGFNPWVGRIPWRREWQPTPIFLPGESHGQRSLAGYSPRNCKESDSVEHTQHRTGLSIFAWQPIEYVSEGRRNNFRWFWFLHLLASISKFITIYRQWIFKVCNLHFSIFFVFLSKTNIFLLETRHL